MTDEKLKGQIGTNISNLRKRQGFTQAMLGEKLNYSDKAVSKWERGESMPDILTLVSISEVLGLSFFCCNRKRGIVIVISDTIVTTSFCVPL